MTTSPGGWEGPFGVKITIGRAFAIGAWRRRRWKYCAAVVGLATLMLPSAASWMNRSIRALECSGPALVAVREGA